MVKTAYVRNNYVISVLWWHESKAWAIVTVLKHVLPEGGNTPPWPKQCNTF